MICCHSNLNADRVEPGMVARSDAYPPGMLKVAGLILTSGKTFLVMKKILRPFSLADSRRAVVSYRRKNVH